MRKSERVFRAAMYWVGIVTTVLILAVLIFAGYCAARHPALFRGVVTGYSFNDGRPTYVEYVFGNWTIRKTSGDGQRHYYLQITNDYGNVDYWEVSQEDYATVEIGTAVSRSQFK